MTIVYDGEVSHSDSTGGGGTIGTGEVQWMTAGGGIIHEEYHSPGFSKTGGPFRMVQLWVNLPAKDKMTPARYQAITRDMIPELPIAGGSTARIIAGSFEGTTGPASTCADSPTSHHEGPPSATAAGAGRTATLPCWPAWWAGAGPSVPRPGARRPGACCPAASARAGARRGS